MQFFIVFMFGRKGAYFKESLLGATGCSCWKTDKVSSRQLLSFRMPKLQWVVETDKVLRTGRQYISGLKLMHC